jgi:hypothetical protein
VPPRRPRRPNPREEILCRRYCAGDTAPGVTALHTCLSFPRRCVPEQSLISQALLYGVVYRTAGISHPAQGTPGLRSRARQVTGSWVPPSRGEASQGCQSTSVLVCCARR